MYSKNFVLNLTVLYINFIGILIYNLIKLYFSFCFFIY